MRIVRTKIMRLIGKKYMLFFCWLLAAPEAFISDSDVNHELIHYKQMKEFLFIFFYLWYGIEWLVRLIQYRQGSYVAYRNVSFEREAYQNEKDFGYLSNRKRFAFMKYLK